MIVRDICKWYFSLWYQSHAMPILDRAPWWMAVPGICIAILFCMPSRIAMQPQLRVPTSGYRYGASRICAVLTPVFESYAYSQHV